MPTRAMMILAASDVCSVIGRSLVILAIIVILFLCVARLRKWLKEDEPMSGGIGFTLSDLRELKARGEMTEEEFERARAKMVAAGKAMAAKVPDPLAGRRGKGDKNPL